jgi:hypothetical protein
MRDGLRYETGLPTRSGLCSAAVLSVDESRVWMGPRLASEKLIVGTACLRLQ